MLGRSHQDTLDTLRQLSELNDQSVQLHQKKVEQRAYDHDVTDLKESVRRLRAEEAELKRQLISTGTSKPLHDVLKRKLTTDSTKQTHTEESITQPVKDKVVAATMRNVEQHKLNEMYIAYRLAGCSIFNVSETRIGIRFDTFFKGRYYESYYVFLDSDPVTGAASVYRHTLPYFVDMDDLKETLARDVREFLSAVEDLLGALVSRRQQIVEVERCFKGRMHDVFCSHAFDLVQGSIVDTDAEAGTSRVYEFQLNFGGLLHTVPRRMTVRETEALGAAQVLAPGITRRFMDTEGSLLDRFVLAFL